jgi:MATE family multidrug resistance protein
LTIFAAALGPAEVATWAILGSIWDIFEASTEGIGDAAEVRCAHHLGKGNPEMAKTSSYKSILFATILSGFVSIIFFSLSNELPRWFTTDPTLQRMISELVPLVGIGNVTMTFGMVCWALVGAQGRYGLATFVSFVSSWCITIPLSALFVFGLNVDLQGVTSAVVIGYSCTGTVLSFILLRSDWECLSETVQKLNALSGEVVSDSESDDDDDDDDDDSNDSSSSDDSSESSSSSSSSSESDISLSECSDSVSAVLSSKPEVKSSNVSMESSSTSTNSTNGEI